MASINLIGRDNGVGLSRDMRLVANALSAAGFEVRIWGLRRGKLRKWLRPLWMKLRVAGMRAAGTAPADLNLMFEHVHRDFLPLARRTALLPNPEWFDERDRALFDRVDAVLAKTRHAQAVFEALGKPTEFVGFTSEDRLLPGRRRELAFFHLAGRSGNKGTQRLLALWRRHPEWPVLRVLQNPCKAQPGPAAANIEHRVGYVGDDELRRLQNEHAVHLCPSETEGFGHYIVEAMSVGAVTITLDAEPMNELVGADRGVLVAAAARGRQHLATTYHFDEAAMEAAIERVLAMPSPERERIGARARAWYEANDRQFGDRLVAAVRNLLKADRIGDAAGAGNNDARVPLRPGTAQRQL
ncbi:glycosyltransferase [Vulcaniibacterium tengchongense]|uniref:Glycosyl transferase family 1 n=1 Tax=Vulcaniibacterium tengchongense TaxID=1273429 RepID=A0A3N4VEA4_9GAMM|nr:glycosyltransferase [Vulcaniibacterium tengchongense]RPE79825.1 glycosyl transferase family 1 [Vulcaniibacterium tengchongense]